MTQMTQHYLSKIIESTLTLPRAALELLADYAHTH